MSAQVYTYKVNEFKMSTTTADHLESKDGDLPFCVYLDNENEDIALANMKYPANQNDLWDYDDFIATFRNSPSEVTAGHLGMVYNWLHRIYDIWMLSDGVTDEILDKHGFEIVFDIDGKAISWIYMHELGNYTDFKELEYGFYDHGLYLFESQVYMDGLNYLLTLLSKVCLDKKYLANDECSDEDVAFLSSHTETKLVSAFAEGRLRDIRIITEEEDQEDSSRYRSLDAYYYWNAYYMYSQLKELQQKLQNYKGLIFINYSN